MDKKMYNTGQPIDIETLSKDELKEAFHEWAEGCDILENLLIEAYNKGLFSRACCSGDMVLPHVVFKLKDDNVSKIAIYIAEQLLKSGLDCRVGFFDNFELNEWYPDLYPQKELLELNITAHRYNRDEVFGVIIRSIKEAKIENIKLPTKESEIPYKHFENLLEEELKVRKKNNNLKQNEQQLINGVIEQSKEIGIRIDEINSANREIRERMISDKGENDQTYDKEV